MTRPDWYEKRRRAEQLAEKWKAKWATDATAPDAGETNGAQRPQKKQITKANGHAHFKFDWQRAFSNVEGASLERGLTPVTRLVLWTVSRFMDADGTGAHPGQERIAKAAGLSLRTTKLHLELAVKLGWLRRERNYKSRYGTGYTYEASLPTEGGSTKPGFVISRIRNARKGDS